VVLNDINEECILTYKVVQNYIDGLIAVLRHMEGEFKSKESMESKEEMYYIQRNKFNEGKTSIDYNNFSQEWIEHAALMIFLNKTCFNGLYRQNRKGLFNVPFGKYKNPTICDEENLLEVNRALKGVELLSKHFSDLTDEIDDKTFIYMDPPYRPLNDTSSFNDYSKVPFNDDSQRELARWFKLLNDEKKACLMLSNSDPKNTNPDDDFFDKLYEGFNIERIKASRAINSKGSGRGEIDELLITNKICQGDKMDNNKKFIYNKSDETFNFLMSSLRESVKSWDYFVNWTKVNTNVRDVEMHLNLMNYLIGKENIEEEFKYLLSKHPEIIETIPVLIASRDNKFEILFIESDDKLNAEVFDFSKKKKLNSEDIDKAVTFAKNSGIFDLFRNKTIKNLVDYVFGVEVGLDSNGRKNRTGTAMEGLAEIFIKNISNKHGFKYMVQATPTRIKAEWGYDVTVDRSERRFDFAVNTGKKLFLVETNFYGGGGSKLKATAGEYKTLYDVAAGDGHEFIWITDGVGWHTANRPLEETFNHNKYILNLKMIEFGVLEDILTGKLEVK
jgi:type II restriction enzyme